MRRIAAIALTALATTGCVGSGSSGSGSEASQPSNDRSGPPVTSVMITYTVSSTCPPGAQCPATSDNQLYYTVSRHLTCSPGSANGNYTDPAAACRALADIETKQHRQQSAAGPVVICGCVHSRDAPKAVGYYRGKRRTIRLDGCSLCNLKDIGADLKILLPGVPV
jgi:hypothetical protein